MTLNEYRTTYWEQLCNATIEELLKMSLPDGTVEVMESDENVSVWVDDRRSTPITHVMINLLGTNYSYTVGEDGIMADEPGVNSVFRFVK